MRQTADVLKEIAAHIGLMNTHMEAIASAVQEQAAGLAEVNQAVNQMDQSTQQNAQMVDQSTHAASVLAEEAERLKVLTGRFTLPMEDRVPMRRRA